MRRGGRQFGRIARSLLERRHWRALARSLTRYERPVEGLLRYALNTGGYPVDWRLKTPVGPVTARLHHPHDMRTVNEIFARGDYDVPETVRTVVDFGSNIGVSALWFLSRNPEVRVWCYEPVAQNVERLRENLAPFAARAHVEPVAVGVEEGEVAFGVEETGRYGGIGLAHHGEMVTVPCRDANAVLAAVLAETGRIDVLKIDIEALEHEILSRIPADMLSRIDRILVEQRYATSPLAEFDLEQYGYVARLTRRGASG